MWVPSDIVYFCFVLALRKNSQNHKGQTVPFGLSNCLLLFQGTCILEDEDDSSFKRPESQFSHRKTSKKKKKGKFISNRITKDDMFCKPLRIFYNALCVIRCYYITKWSVWQ